MNRGLLLGTLGTVLLAASLESIAAGRTAVPPPVVIGGTAAAGLALAALGSGAPQLANGLTGLLLLTALLRLPWPLVTNALARLGDTTTAPGRRRTAPTNAR